jgi:peroxiredoxin
MITALRRLALFAALASCAHAQTWKPWEGPAPELRARTLAGEELRLSDYAGRAVLVNFWATWCAPWVEVIAVNFQENAARIQPFVERLGITFPVVRDHDGTLRTAWRVNVFPSTYLIGPDGRVRIVAVGEANWDDPQVESRIRALQ